MFAESGRKYLSGQAFLAVAAVIIAIAYAPMLTVFFQQRWNRPETQFFPFVLAAFVALIWVRWKEAPVVTTKEKWPMVATALAIFALVTLLLAIAIYNPWLAAFSWIVLMAAVLTAVGRHRNVRYLWGIWALLLLILPLPLDFDQQLIARLQILSSQLSSNLLDVVGIHHLMEGNTLALSKKHLFVDEACSGIVSLMSIVACGVIYGVWMNRPPLHIVLLAVAGIIWAVVMNVYRISIIAMALELFDIDWSSGMSHEVLSLGLFLVTTLGMFVTDKLLVELLEPIRRRWELLGADAMERAGRLVKWWDALTEAGSPQKSAPASKEVKPAQVPAATAARWTLRPAMILTGFAMLAIGQFGLIAYANLSPIAAVNNVVRAEALTRESMPAEIGTLQCDNFRSERRDRDDIFGEFSRIYEYHDNQHFPYVLSCDFPFTQGWHELTICYRGAGWEVKDRDTTNLPSDRLGEDWTSVEAVLERSDGTHGFVTWSIFDANGEPVSPPVGRIRDQIWRLFTRRNPLVPSAQMFQIQVFTQSGSKITDEQKDAARELLIKTRAQFRNYISSGNSNVDQVTVDPKPAQTTHSMN